jgi:hypothetical protein
MRMPFEPPSGGSSRRIAFCAGALAAFLFAGCWQKIRTVHGRVRVQHASGEPITFDRIELAAYPKAVARNTFAEASLKLGKRYSELRGEVEQANNDEALANTSAGLTPAEDAVFKELRHLLELADTMRDDREARDEIRQRMVELKEETRAAGQTRVLQRFEKLAAIHAQNVSGMDQLRHSAPKLGMLMLQQLPESEYTALAGSNGAYEIRIPADEPYVLSAMGKVKTRDGTDVYCWIVPVKLALGADVVVDLNNENLFTDLNKTKQLVGMSRER